MCVLTLSVFVVSLVYPGYGIQAWYGMHFGCVLIQGGAAELWYWYPYADPQLGNRSTPSGYFRWSFAFDDEPNNTWEGLIPRILNQPWGSHGIRLPFWPVLLASAAAFAYSARRGRPAAGHCHSCGYDLTGNVSGRCPECGALTNDAQHSRVDAGVR